jgi:hypothetical protein
VFAGGSGAVWEGCTRERESGLLTHRKFVIRRHGFQVSTVLGASGFVARERVEMEQEDDDDAHAADFDAKSQDCISQTNVVILREIEMELKMDGVFVFNTNI